MIVVSIFVIVQMALIILPRMKAKRKGVIVNIASTAGKVPGLPYAIVYGGTKVGYRIVYYRAALAKVMF